MLIQLLHQARYSAKLTSKTDNTKGISNDYYVLSYTMYYYLLFIYHYFIMIIIYYF